MDTYSTFIHRAEIDYRTEQIREALHPTPRARRAGLVRRRRNAGRIH